MPFSMQEPSCYHLESNFSIGVAHCVILVDALVCHGTLVTQSGITTGLSEEFVAISIGSRMNIVKQKLLACPVVAVTFQMSRC